MEVNTQPKLKFLGVNIVNVQYNLTKALQGGEQVDINIDPKVFFPEDNPKMFTIIMAVVVKKDNYFHLQVHGMGDFLIEDSESNEDVRKILVNANAPAIMFPYMRAFISTFTTNLGRAIAPTILPTQFFKGDIPEFKPSVLEDNSMAAVDTVK